MMQQSETDWMSERGRKETPAEEQTICKTTRKREERKRHEEENKQRQRGKELRKERNTKRKDNKQADTEMKRGRKERYTSLKNRPRKIERETQK